MNNFCCRYHLASHSASRPYICAKCAKSFKNARDLRTHEKTLHPDEENTSRFVFCTLCPHQPRFASRSAAKAHKRLEHDSGPELHQCGTCKKKFLAASKLELHVR